MKITWGTFWLHSRKWLKTGWLLTAVLVAVYGGVVRPSRVPSVALQWKKPLHSRQLNETVIGWYRCRNRWTTLLWRLV